MVLRLSENWPGLLMVSVLSSGWTSRRDSNPLLVYMLHCPRFKVPGVDRGHRSGIVEFELG
jgi:hypothetical protein